MNLGPNFVPVRVGVSRCHPSRGIYFLAQQPPGYRPDTLAKLALHVDHDNNDEHDKKCRGDSL